MKVFTIINILLLAFTLSAQAEDIEQSGYSAELKLIPSGSHLPNFSNSTRFGDGVVTQPPIYFVFKVDDEGKVSVKEARMYTVPLRYEIEKLGGAEIDLEMLGYYFRDLHKEIGYVSGATIASVELSKAFELSDGVTFIVAGRARFDYQPALRLSDGSKKHLRPLEEGESRDKSFFNQDAVNLDLETTGTVRFNYGKGHFEAKASYSYYDDREFNASGTEEKIYLSESEAKLELSYKPDSRKGSKFTIGVKQTEFDRSMGAISAPVTDTQIYFRYEYAFTYDNGLMDPGAKYYNDRYDNREYNDDPVDVYNEEEEYLPEIY